jgi:ketosteroid isomerase-like protein
MSLSQFGCWLLLASSVLVVPADRNQADSRKSAETAIQQADRDFCRAVVEKRFELFKTFIAEDAVFHSSGMIVRGRDAVVKDWSPLFEAGASTSLRWEPRAAEASTSGDLGYTLGDYATEGVDRQGLPVRARGHYVTVWRRQPDGTWRVVVDIGTPPQQ